MSTELSIQDGRAELQKLKRRQKASILNYLKSMDPILFEHLTGAIFEEQGYRVETTVASGDEGVDVKLRKGFKTAVVQCKRYGGSVGQPVVRDLYGTMLHNKAAEAYLVTTGSITKQAQEWSEGKPIELVDGFTLVEWIATSTGRGWWAPLLSWRLAGAIILLLALLLYWNPAPIQQWTTALFADEGSSTPVIEEPSPTPTTETAPPLPPTLTAMPDIIPPIEEEERKLYLPLILNAE